MPILAAMLWGALAAAATPARPLARNPACPYPKEAKEALATGDVRFKAIVRADGTVESVTIEQAPEDDLGFGESVRSTVAQWRFEPATFQGKPIVSTYRDVIPFDLFHSLDRARVFPVGSKDALAAMERVLKKNGLRLATRDEEGGVLITQPAPLSKIDGSGLDPKHMVDGAYVESFEVHAFVSRDVEPAHVHVDTQINLRSADRRSHIFSRGPIERWLLDAVAAELGKEGHPMPYSSKGLGRLQRELGFPQEDCTPTEVRLPVAIRSSLVKPLYPVGQINRRDSAKVAVHARILRDGVVVADDATITGSSDSQFKAAALAAARLWRYHPGREGTCPVQVYMTVTVTFDAN